MMETYRNPASQRVQMGQGYTLLVDIGTQTGLSARERGSIKFVSAAPWLRTFPGNQEGGGKVTTNIREATKMGGLFNIAMENGPFIDDFPSKTSIYNGLSIAILNSQMV